jgi:gliding motility-associated-like protein
MKTKAQSYTTLAISSLISLLSLSFLQDAKAQSSLYLPAATNWVSTGDLDVTGNQLTVEALIYYTGTSLNIVSKHSNSSNVNYLLRIGSFEITTTSGHASFTGIPAGMTISANQMYHLAATYNGAVINYYVNGCLTGSMPWTGNLVQNNFLTAIGNQSDCLCEQFIGYIDEVRIWNVARTQAQISANMANLPSPTTQPGLQGYWSFNGNYLNQQGTPAYNGIAQGLPQLQQAPLPYPKALFESVTSSNPVCSGEANGIINVAASGFYSPYEYSLDGITYNTSPVFTGLPAGTYTVYTRPQNNNNCTVSSSIALIDPPVLNPNLNSTNIACNGAENGSATVAPSGGHGPAYHQLWQPSLNTTSGISGLSAGNYSVSVVDSCRKSGPELVANGQFEDGNTGFSSDYTCCSGNPDHYAVDSDPSFYNGGHLGSGYGGGGNYLIADGSLTPGTDLWCQTIPVSPNTYYSLSAFVASNINTNPAIIQFQINGSSVGSVTAPTAIFTWLPFQMAWFSGASTSATICIQNLNTIFVGNDFGIDNISFKACISCTVTVPFTITEPSALTITTTQTEVSCNAGTDGTATVVAGGGTPVYTYMWNTTPVQSSATANNLSAGTYSVTVTDQNLCTITATVTITEPPAMIISLTQTNNNCYGDANGTATVTATGAFPPYTYSWNTTPAQVTATANNLIAGTYSVTITDSNSCSQSLIVTITDPPQLTMNLTASDTIICLGISSNLNSVVTGGTGIYSYSWSNGPTTAGQTVQPSVTTNYILTVSDAQGCTISDSVLITSIPALSATIDLGNDTAICQGDVITLDAGPGFVSYLWQTGSTTQTVNVSISDQYFLTAIDTNGCISGDTIIISINPIPLVGLADSALICPGATVTLSANPGYVTYLWNTGLLTPSITVNTAGFQSVTVTDINGCSNSDSTLVIMHPVPLLQPSAQPLTGCQPLNITTLNASVLNGSVVTSWDWQIGSNTFNQFAPSTVLYSSGLYDVFLQATTDKGCVVDTLLLNYIEVYPRPNAIIVPESYVYELFNPNIVLDNQSSLATLYTWSLSGIYVSNTTDLLYPITDTGNYNFQLIAMNQYGCLDTTDVLIRVNPSFGIYFPNAFTPNGNDINDQFLPKGYGITEYEIMIFDRWGEMVFRSTDMSRGWDGTYKNGLPFPDVYAYRCVIKDVKENLHYYTGAVTLVQ